MCPLSVKGQDIVSRIYESIDNEDFVLAQNLIDSLDNEPETIYNDSLYSELLYLKGVLKSKSGEYSQSINLYKQSCIVSEKSNCQGTSYLDAIYNIMRWQLDQGDYRSCVTYGYKATKLSTMILSDYPGSSHIYGLMSNALMALYKFVEVPHLVFEGMNYAKLRYTPKDASYYELLFCEVASYLMMGKIDNAEFALSNIKDVYEAAGEEIYNIKEGIFAFSEEIVKAKTESRVTKMQKRKETIEKINHNILLASTTSQDGAKFWKQYFDIIRSTLEYFYFDTSDPEDEKYWNWMLSQQKTHFYVCCSDLLDRETEAYDQALLRKNFLEYHSGKLHKSPQSWTDIEHNLSEGEAAIEVTQLPDEILILKKGLSKPISVAIDSALNEHLCQVDLQDPIAISKLYEIKGPLYFLWKTIEPYLDNISTIYFSASNIFTQFNYGAIPIDETLFVSDKYDLRNLISTADIEYIKQNNINFDFKTVSLYGGIIYDSDKESLIASTTKYKMRDVAPEWALTRGLDDETRGKFGYLPGSLEEVNSINNICLSHNIETNLFTSVEANEESLKSLSGKATDVLHISTHGFMLAPLFNSENREFVRKAVGNKYQTILAQSGLLLAGANYVWQGNSTIEGIEDGILTSKEISELDLSKVKLAVLSACDSGLGDITNLQGASYGVHYALKNAGVEKILACLWKVNDQSTSLFMQYFYKNLLSGYNYHDAIRISQKELQRVGYINPYYWAPYILIE